MKALLLAAFLSGCGFYTIDHECESQPDEGSEIEGDLTGVVVSDDGTVVTTKTRDASFTSGPRVELHVGPTLTFRAPTGPGMHRLEDLDARLCSVANDCVPARGSLDVVVWEEDGVDATVHPEEEPVAATHPALRGSARLLYRRWDREVCRSVRKGSDSAFAVRY